jgi:hypothetical protein
MSIRTLPIVMSMGIFLGCHGPHNNPAMTPHGKIALAFAKALAAGDYDVAHRMLTPELGTELPAATLKNKYEQMISYTGKTKATAVEIMNTLEDFPAKERTDVGWAYASIVGPHEEGGSWGEAVAVIVAERDGQLLIRDIECGRP